MADLHLDLSETAVLAMDFQQMIVSANAMAKQHNVLQKAKAVLDGARNAVLPVIHVVIQFRRGYPEVSARNRMFSGIKDMGIFITGQDGANIDKSLSHEEGDIIVSRPRVNAFYSSDLQSILSSKEVHTLVLMGISTEWVVEATARYAVDAVYRVIVLEDCCASMSVEVHEFTIAKILSRITEISNSEEFLANLQ